MRYINLHLHYIYTCEVGYLCANFSLPRPLCSRVTPDVRDRQTDVRQKHRLMPPPIRGVGIIMWLFGDANSFMLLWWYD